LNAPTLNHIDLYAEKLLAKARQACDASVDRALASASDLLHQEGHLRACLNKMGMAAALSAPILEALGPPQHK
jgi:hypothetical protein